MDPEWLTFPDGRRIAVRHRAGGSGRPTILFLPGYASDMMGSKAVALDELAAATGLGMARFDYSGTGESSGCFADGTLDRWLEEATAVARSISGELILVGSSMGGWLMLLLSEMVGERLQGLVGIAAAPDFTDWGYDDADKAQLASARVLHRDNPYGGDAEVTTFAFWESGERLKLLHRSIDFDGPVRLLHGDQDGEVPLEIASRIKDRLLSGDVHVTIVKGGTHRLSGPAELQLLRRTVLDLAFDAQAPTC